MEGMLSELSLERWIHSDDLEVDFRDVYGWKREDATQILTALMSEDAKAADALESVEKEIERLTDEQGLLKSQAMHKSYTVRKFVRAWSDAERHRNRPEVKSRVDAMDQAVEGGTSKTNPLIGGAL